jgi:hypothetical protein
MTQVTLSDAWHAVAFVCSGRLRRHRCCIVCINHESSLNGVQGVKLLFYNSAADVLLLDIPSTIPDRFTPFYIGELAPSRSEPLPVHPASALLPLSVAPVAGWLAWRMVLCG